MELTKLTRQMYLDGDITHEEYYAQFVTERELSVVKDIDINASLKTWDTLPDICLASQGLMIAVNESYTLSTKVCIYKTAKRKLLKIQGD